MQKTHKFISLPGNTLLSSRHTWSNFLLDVFSWSYQWLSLQTALEIFPPKSDSSNVSCLSEWHTTPPVIWHRSYKSMNSSSPSFTLLLPPYMIHYQILSFFLPNISQCRCLLGQLHQPILPFLPPGLCNCLYTNLCAQTRLSPQFTLHGHLCKIKISSPSSLKLHIVSDLLY